MQYLVDTSAHYDRILLTQPRPPSQAMAERV